MKKLFFTFIFLFIISCSDIEFVYKENKNLVNPLFEKTEIATSGYSINFMNSYLPMLFGSNKEDRFNLQINIDQNKTKRAVETNQVTTRKQAPAQSRIASRYARPS